MGNARIKKFFPMDVFPKSEWKFVTVDCSMCQIGTYGKCSAVCQQTTMCIILRAAIFGLKINLQQPGVHK